MESCFYTPDKLFTRLPDVEAVAVSERIFKELDSKDINLYIKTASVNSVFNGSGGTYQTLTLDHKGQDALMNFIISDPNHEINSVSFTANSMRIADFYWNEEDGSWRSGFNENCPFFIGSAKFSGCAIAIESSKEGRYNVEMTKIRFSDDMKKHIESFKSFDTVMNGKIIRYQGGLVGLACI